MGRIVALVLVLALSVWPVAAQAGRRVALVIGNGGYGEVAKLPNPPNDARAIGAALERLGFDVHLAIDVTQVQLLAAVDDYAQTLTGADAALLFYAGHGIQLDGLNYLLPVDINVENERSVRYGAVDVSEVVAEMERASPVNIILLDACRNNPFVEELKRSLKTRAVNVARGLAPI